MGKLTADEEYVRKLLKHHPQSPRNKPDDTYIKVVMTHPDGYDCDVILDRNDDRMYDVRWGASDGDGKYFLFAGDLEEMHEELEHEGYRWKK